VKHELLFQRLKGILSEEEIQFLRAIYSRNVIRLGKYLFRPNVGVAQGSIISPYLFDIYLEDLLKLIVLDGKLVPLENVLGYADDVLILCTEIGRLKKVISTIEEWAIPNGMLLNRKKSAVVEFLPRHAQKRFITGSHILEIPVQNRYKYLAVWLNQKLHLEDQIAHIRKKSDFLSNRLGPLLSKSSLEYRKNLWELFVRPLFEFTLPIHAIEPTQSRKQGLKNLLKHTFKRFTKISKTAPDSLVLRLCGYDLDQRAEEVVCIQREKWNYRKKIWVSGVKQVADVYITLKEIPILSEDEIVDSEEENTNLCKNIPAIGVEYANLLTRICPKCPEKRIMNKRHLMEVHNLNFPDPLVFIPRS